MLIALAVVCLLCGFTGTGTDFTFGSDRTMSVREAYTALEELGISGITEDTVREIEAYEEEYGLDLNNYNPVPDLLYYAGAGEYDPEDWSWTPSRNGVYTFDMEAWEVSMMYTDFLNGVSAMSNGELIFSDIVEDNSRVDMESGTGTKYISFDFQGDRHRVSAEMMYDWMDMDALNSIAEVVNRSGGEKKLWFLFSESQCVSVFYRNEAWAEQFRDMTGYTLTTSIPYGY